jgi:MSHA biogenesis protein MshL
LGCTIPKAGPTQIVSGGAGQGSSGASRADISHPGISTNTERLRGVDGCIDGRALNVNQMSGTILVRGMPKDLRLAEQVLRAKQLNISRQVIIEAKIIDVELNRDSQQGINWAAFRDGAHRFSVGANPNTFTVNQPAVGSASGGVIDPSTTLAGLLGDTLIGVNNNAFSAGLGVAVQARNFNALINFLESQGRVHVLSSPRIATLNNQKAVLKVGSEEPFVTNVTSGTTTTTTSGTTIPTEPTLNYQPFFSGISLDVTPQIDDQDVITLHVHSMVNNIIEKQKVALLKQGTRAPFAANTISEADSVVRAQDGQVIVIGGLMTESSADNRAGVPGVRDVPGFGGLFNRGAQTATKRELVILLRPTIVKDGTAWANDISATGNRIDTLSRPNVRR